MELGENGSDQGSREGSLESADIASGGELSVLDLAARVHRKLSLPDDHPLPVAFHRSAVKCMQQLRDALIGMTRDADQDVRLYLLYAGIAVQRRMLLNTDVNEIDDFRVTLSLLYVLQVLCDSRTRSPMPLPPTAEHTAGKHEESKPVRSPDAEALHQWDTQSLWERLLDVEAEERGPSGWATTMRLTPDSICRSCCAESSRKGQKATLASLGELADKFFRCSALTLAYNMLGAAQLRSEREPDFLTLDSVNFLSESNDQRHERLRAVVDAAETEAGQQVLRDLILSFRLPPKVVGVRRTPLMTRQATKVATELHAMDLQGAHETAMRGAEWSWRSDDDKLHQACALLSGLCIIFAGRGSGLDAIRKKDAFAGRVNLPFLETASPPPGVKRMALIPHRNEWIVYTIDKSHKPTVQLRHAGMEGLCQAVLLLTSKQ